MGANGPDGGMSGRKIDSESECDVDQRDSFSLFCDFESLTYHVVPIRKRRSIGGKSPLRSGYFDMCASAMKVAHPNKAHRAILKKNERRRQLVMAPDAGKCCKLSVRLSYTMGTYL